MILSPKSRDTTFVSVTNSGFKGSITDQAALAVGSTERSRWCSSASRPSSSTSFENLYHTYNLTSW